MQLFYISNRPIVLNDTLELVNRCMTFIHEVIVVMPQAIIPKVKKNYHFKLTYLPEEEILESQDKEGLDHSTLNYLLRTKVVGNYKGLEDEFIMSDDDYRPLVPISESEFKADNKYRSYYFYDVKDWKFTVTDFDKCLHNSKNALAEYNYPTLAYASHMPQIINKALFLESAYFFSDVAQDMSLCEWTTYFNYAKANYPELFHESEPYANICWPDYPNIWPEFVKPQKALFENFYEHLYNNGDLFEGIDPVGSSENMDFDLALKLERIETFKTKHHIPYLTYRAKYLRIAIKFMNSTSPMIRRAALGVLNVAMSTKRQVMSTLSTFI